MSVMLDTKNKKEEIFDYVIKNEENILSATNEISHLSQYISVDFDERFVTVDNLSKKEDANDTEGLSVGIKGLLGSREEELYNEHIQKILNGNPVEEIGIDKGIIIFNCGGRGIAPSSQYYGFYYSVDNKPVAVFGNSVLCDSSQMTKKDNGYEYRDSGYNSYYVEKIKDNFYFYEASF